jgi:hypothetical protein
MDTGSRTNEDVVVNTVSNRASDHSNGERQSGYGRDEVIRTDNRCYASQRKGML